MKKLLIKLAMRALNKPIVRAYPLATLVSVIPIGILGLLMAFYVNSFNGDVNKVETQVNALSIKSDEAVPKGAVATRFNEGDLVNEWIILQLFMTVLGGVYVRIVLGKGTMLAAEQLVAEARAAAGGDLSVQPGRWFNNEYGDLQEAFGQMVGSFRETIAQIESAAAELKQSAGEMAHTSDEAGHAIGEVAQAISSISEGASHQVSLVSRASDVVAEIEGSIRDTSEHAREAQRQSADTERLSEEGVQRAAEVQDAMRAVRESSLNTAGVIRGLGEKSSDIDIIVRAITDIAAQTNMLALNASIEAARAGEQGKGFANVAEEVRILAEDAQNSAEEIAALVREIQSQTAQAVSAMEDGVVRVEEGFDTINRNRETFGDISGAVRELHQSSTEISELADGIAIGAGQVRGQIEEVASVAEQSSASTQQVSASTEETSAAAEEVSASAQRVAQTAANLAELAGRFTLPEDMRPKAAAGD
ncbi:MAG: methyl-accepting chemotaxis protein [Actinobacteria bacterium]|nr:methyl-accepting chemotaxis protein [Actinomycetota bacterium]